MAQVVLNRVRNTEFPNSVCGVVYEGSWRPTGCQFTFTCDGSLARTPSRAGWARARQVAQRALAGDTAAEVGLATHYHADYVAPYWRSSLARIGQIGSHIFYVWPGSAGKAAAFTMPYSGIEPSLDRVSLATRPIMEQPATAPPQRKFEPTELAISDDTAIRPSETKVSKNPAPDVTRLALRPLALASEQD